MTTPKILQQTFRNHNGIIKQSLKWTLMSLLLLLQFTSYVSAKFVGDVCRTKSQPGVCLEWAACPGIKTLIDRGEYSIRDVVNCGFSPRQEIICCPAVREDTQIENKNDNGTDRFETPNQKSTVKSNTDRPAIRACRRLEKGLKNAVVDHVLGGTPVHFGEYPHMAGIGFSRIGGEDKPPYDIRCGGSLIDKRFVITVAHCVSNSMEVPSIVRLGVVNNTAGSHMKDAVEIKINRTFIHDDYSISKSYNDIAILELERDVETNSYIYPLCLYTDVNDPDTDKELWVSGWGIYNTSTQSFSNILLKASLHTVPFEKCSTIYDEQELELTRLLRDGLKQTQICATYTDKIKDACQGDSGGPLHMIVDETKKNFRLVGLVSIGFSCGSPTPGLYTRVASYLDFIEQIVWPNGGD